MTEEMKARKKVVIAGGGTAGWMAAAALSKTFGETIDLTLIESEQIGTIGVGEATIPPLQKYNGIIGITEIEFMKQTKGTFKLGINFENWTKKDHAYFHSFGSTGKDHWTCTFNHFWMSGLARGHNQPYGDYCLELMAAEQNKFAHLPDKSLNYAFHLDSPNMLDSCANCRKPMGRCAARAKLVRFILIPKPAISPQSPWKMAARCLAICSLIAPVFELC